MPLSESGRRIIKGKRGQKSISFREGGEHESLGVPASQPISASKHEAARRGEYGEKAKRQEIFRQNVLTGRK